MRNISNEIFPIFLKIFQPVYLRSFICGPLFYLLIYFCNNVRFSGDQSGEPFPFDRNFPDRFIDGGDFINNKN